MVNNKQQKVNDLAFFSKSGFHIGVARSRRYHSRGIENSTIILQSTVTVGWGRVWGAFGFLGNFLNYVNHQTGHRSEPFTVSIHVLLFEREKRHK